MSDNNLIIENGHNTSYIISLMVSLFYKPSGLDTILSTEPKDRQFAYAQEFIKGRFIEPMRRGFSIHSSTINEFRNYINQCNWSPTLDTLISNRNIAEFYDYFIKKIYGDDIITFKRIIDNEETSIKSTHITLDTIDGLKINSVTNMFKLWIKSKITLDKHKYKIDKFPRVFSFYINRKEDDKTKIDIMAKIKLFDVSDNLQDNISWNIHSLICKDSDNSYYSVIKDDTLWYMVSDKSTPAFEEIDMADELCANKISTEVVMVIYKLLHI
jgi:hypothetical protein